jgi:hypothetical protein
VPLAFFRGAFLVHETRCLSFYQMLLSSLHFRGAFLVHKMRCLFFYWRSFELLAFFRGVFLISEM